MVHISVVLTSPTWCDVDTASYRLCTCITAQVIGQHERISYYNYWWRRFNAWRSDYTAAAALPHTWLTHGCKLLRVRRRRHGQISNRNVNLQIWLNSVMTVALVIYVIQVYVVFDSLLLLIITRFLLLLMLTGYAAYVIIIIITIIILNTVASWTRARCRHQCRSQLDQGEMSSSTRGRILWL